MPWFLALNPAPSKGGQSPTYELQNPADVERITQQMANFAAADKAVEVPAVFNNGKQQVTVYVRPSAWGAWAIYEMSEEERREAIAANPLVNAIAQARAAKQQTPQASPAARPATGPSAIPRLD